MIPSTLRGHDIAYDGTQYRYVDNAEPTVGSARPCGRCGNQETSEGHDACIGTLPGVLNACCGHGDTGEAYVQFDGGDREGDFLAGQEAVDWLAAMKRIMA